MPHTLPAPPKSSETRAIMLLISRDSEHLRRLCGDPKAPATPPLTAGPAKSRLSPFAKFELVINLKAERHSASLYRPSCSPAPSGDRIGICPLRCMSLLLARLRHADCVEQCPSSRAKRKTYARTEFFSV